MLERIPKQGGNAYEDLRIIHELLIPTVSPVNEKYKPNI